MLIARSKTIFSYVNIFVLCITIILVFTHCKNDANDNNNKAIKQRDVFTTADSLEWDRLITKIDSAGMLNDFSKELAALQEATTFCKVNNYPISLFNCYLITNQRYANSLGEYDKAKLYLDSAAMVIEEHKLYRLKPQLYNALASRHSIIKTDSAIFYYKKALEDTSILSDYLKRVLYSSISRSYLYRGYYKEAKHYIEEALAIVNKDTSITKQANLAHLNQYLYFAEINLGDTAKAYQTIKKAYTILVDSLAGNGDISITRSMGDYHFWKQNYDSALFFYNQISLHIPKEGTNELRTGPYLLRAYVLTKLNKFEEANELFKKVESSKEFNTSIKNESLEQQYLGTKYALEKHYGKPNEAIKTLEKLSEVEKEYLKEQQSKALTSFEENLTQARAENTITKQKSDILKQRIYTYTLAIASVLLGIIGLLIFLNLRRQKKLDKQKLETFKQQTALEKINLKLATEQEERQRISQEIHDDIGPALTTLNLAAGMLNNAELEGGLKKSVSIITKNTTRLSGQMNEIIWSLNINNDKLQSLVAYIKLFATNFLETANIKLAFDAQIVNNERIIEGYKRRHIYLTVKEIINNAVKHAQASIISITIIEKENSLYIKVADNGVGLPEDAINSILGNGLKNTAKNIHKMNGQINVFNNNGCNTELNIPLEYKLI